MSRRCSDMSNQIINDLMFTLKFKENKAQHFVLLVRNEVLSSFKAQPYLLDYSRLSTYDIERQIINEMKLESIADEVKLSLQDILAGINRVVPQTIQSIKRRYEQVKPIAPGLSAEKYLSSMN